MNKTYYIETYGCQMNVYDSELVATQLENSGYHKTDKIDVADAISGSRPGARRENFEQYVKRIRSLEEIASASEGVKEAFALQAGREVRIIVSPDKVEDLAAIKIA